MKLLFSSLLLFLSHFLLAQVQMHSPKSQDHLPLWAQMMYSENTNYNAVIEEYKKYHSTNSFIKTRHTQYFNRWISANKNRVQLVDLRGKKS